MHRFSIFSNFHSTVFAPAERRSALTNAGSFVIMLAHSFIRQRRHEQRLPSVGSIPFSIPTHLARALRRKADLFSMEMFAHRPRCDSDHAGYGCVVQAFGRKVAHLRQNSAVERARNLRLL
jgi:hypothetical protein